MASTTKRRFTEEFKREAVALWETNGLLETEVAAELGIMPTMLRRWQRQLQESSAPAAKPSVSTMASPADQASEIARLRRELDRARMGEQHASTWPVNVMCRSSACRAAAIMTGAAGHRVRGQWRTWRCSATCVGARRDIRGDTDRRGSCRPAGGRAPMQPRPRRAADAPASYPRAGRAAVPAIHDRQSPLSADRAEAAGAALRGTRAEPDLARRHHPGLRRGRLSIAATGTACTQPSGTSRPSKPNGARPANPARPPIRGKIR